MASTPNPDATLNLPLLPIAAEGCRASGEIEEEVINLFNELRNRLLRYILSFGIPSADGEEIIQEAFLSLVQHMRRGRSRHNLRGWLFRVAHNQALKRVSGNVRHRELIDPCGLDSDVHPDPAMDPEEHVTFRQRKARLLAVLRVLPLQDQRCLRLRAEGLRYREIAEVLGISLGSVAASLARSLERLGRADAR